MKSKKLLLAAATALSLFIGIGETAHADLLLTLGTSNDVGNSGPGPYATVQIALIDSTHAGFTFTALPTFAFGDMGLNVNAATFTSSAVSFTARPGDSQTPSYTTLINGSGGASQLDGFGNFTLVQNDQPNGFSASVLSANFTLTDTSGTWANVNQVLTDNASGNSAAVHAFSITNDGASFFATDSGSSCVGAGCSPPPPPPPPNPTPEPMSLALLGAGLLGLGMTRWARRYF